MKRKTGVLLHMGDDARIPEVRVPVAASAEFPPDITNAVLARSAIGERWSIFAHTITACNNAWQLTAPVVMLRPVCAHQRRRLE